MAGECFEALLSAVEDALGHVEEAREALGKHRGKGGGLARFLRRAAQALASALEPCIVGCMLSAGPADAARCSLGAVAEELQRSLHGVAVRLERLPRLSGGTEEELAMGLLDSVAAALRGLREAAETAARLLEGLEGDQ